MFPKPKNSVLNLDAYKPNFGTSNLKQLIRLSANENPLGYSPKIDKELKINLFNRYPPQQCKNLIKTISKIHHLDTSKLITEAGSPGGSRGQNMEKARNAKLIRETVLEELGQADVDKSGSISESESKVLIDSLNTMIEQNEDLKKIMNKVEQT